MPRKSSRSTDSMERKVIETPTLSRLDMGIVNEGFDSIPSPSFFYIDDSSSWAEQRRASDPKRFTESWIELDRAYSCGSSSIDRRKSCSCPSLSRCIVYLLVALSVIGFAAIVSAILYMEIFHKMDYYEWHPLKVSVFEQKITHLPPPTNKTSANKSSTTAIPESTSALMHPTPAAVTLLPLFTSPASLSSMSTTTATPSTVLPVTLHSAPDIPVPGSPLPPSLLPKTITSPSSAAPPAPLSDSSDETADRGAASTIAPDARL